MGESATRLVRFGFHDTSRPETKNLRNTRERSDGEKEGFAAVRFSVGTDVNVVVLFCLLSNNFEEIFPR